MPARLLTLTLLTAALALVAGCTNPFTPETPPPPTGAGVTAVFTTPEKLLETVEAALSARGRSGQTAYFDALAESTAATPERFAFYAFHPPTVVDDWRAQTNLSPPEPWDITLEKRFYDYLSERYTGFTYTFTFSDDDLSPSDPPVDETNGLALKHRKYTLLATSSDSSIELIIAIGYADLYMQRAGGRWYLYRWEDRLDPRYGVHPADPENVCMGRRRLDSTSGAS